ncbi:MAG: helix-turn-helix domain-containing protein [Gemmatimonadales bacterium]|nr:helix-turn-helix domain-containing protein [Gemmatimonadales bacterium]
MPRVLGKGGPPAPNPFQYGRELAPDELVDRRDELAVVHRTMETNGKLFLIGRRRFGKTSLLAAAASTANRDGLATVVREDAERHLDAAALGQALLTEAARRLLGPAERAARKLREVAVHLRPELTIQPDSNTFSVAIGRTAPGGALQTLVEVLDAIDRMGEQATHPVSVIIDEFQHLVVRDGVDGERQLRATVQRHRHVGYIFAGSAVRLLADMTGQHGRPFYRLGSTLTLGRLPRGEFAAFLEAGFARQGWGVEPGAVEAMLDAGEEVPYSVQRIAHEAWELVRVAQGEVALTREIASMAQAKVLRQEGPLYAQLWNGLTAQQQRALAAVVREHGMLLYSKQVARHSGLSTATMQRAIAALAGPSRGLVIEESDPESGSTRHVLEDPMFAAWIAATGRE